MIESSFGERLFFFQFYFVFGQPVSVEVSVFNIKDYFRFHQALLLLSRFKKETQIVIDSVFAILKLAIFTQI